MEFKKFGFFPHTTTFLKSEEVNLDKEIIQNAKEEFSNLMNESSDRIFKELLGIEPPNKVNFEDELVKIIDMFTYLILINISDEDIVKKGIEEVKKESNINIVYITNPYIPQGQIILIQDGELKRQLLNIKRKNNAEKKGIKQDGK